MLRKTKLNINWSVELKAKRKQNGDSSEQKILLFSGEKSAKAWSTAWYFSWTERSRVIESSLDKFMRLDFESRNEETNVTFILWGLLFCWSRNNKPTFVRFNLSSKLLTIGSHAKLWGSGNIGALGNLPCGVSYEYRSD